MDNQPGKNIVDTTQVFFVGYEYQLDSALVKPTLDGKNYRPYLENEVKVCFDCKMFDVANWVALPQQRRWSQRVMYK